MYIGMLIVKPNMMIIPIIELINMFENMNVSDIVLNSIMLIGNIATQADIDTCIIF